jgi:beta-phosphoglucomutase-like phosphatase (HAD superfamily)
MATVHAAAWKNVRRILDCQILTDRRAIQPFDFSTAYRRYVDGTLGSDGVRSFLPSRGVVLAEGAVDDPPMAQTIHDLGARRNQLLLGIFRRDGLAGYEGSRPFVAAARDAGLRRAVVSVSSDCRAVLVGAGIEDLIEIHVYGIVARRDHLRGKPAPDMFLPPLMC